MPINQSTFSSPRSLFAFLSQKQFCQDSESQDPSETTVPPVDDDTARALQNTLDQVSTETVGASLAVVSPEAAWFGVSGVANLNTNTPVNSSDRFQIGSITKTFVATTVLQLVEEGKLSLEDTLEQWLPTEIVSMIPEGSDITIRQLLNHTSGIPDYLSPLLDFGINLFREWQPTEQVELIAGQPLHFSSGTSWQYSNTNYILLGMIVENVTSASVASEVRSRILEPLELDNTFFADTEEVPGGVVSGYWDINADGDLDDMSIISPSIFGSAGAMVSNTEDLADFAQGLFEGDLLEPASLAEMLTFTEAVDSRAFSGYGLGVAQLNTPDELIYGHNGLTLGYRANMWYEPDNQLVYIDLQNTRTINNFIEPILTTWRQYQDPDAGYPDFKPYHVSDSSLGTSHQNPNYLESPIQNFEFFTHRANFAQSDVFNADVFSMSL